MAQHFQRGQLLYEQGRYEQAIGEFQLHLGQHAEDPLTHALMAMCFTRLEKLREATEHAQRAIHLSPDVSVGYWALSLVMFERHRLDESKRLIEEAIRLKPYEADYFAILATIYLQKSRWREALEAANQGLQIEPEHDVCTNLRAQALVNLGDRAGAAETMGEALARRPDDAWTHANQGWALLHQGDPYKALEHFRESLRLAPGNEWARSGIVEAMKARNFVYRWMLAYFLWMARLPPRVQWGLVIGGFIGAQVVRQIADGSPMLAPFLWTLLIVYGVFVLMTWLASPLFNLLLRLNRFGRHALSPDQIRGANVLLASLLVALGWLAAASLWGGDTPLLWLAVVWFVILSLPASAIFRCQAGWPRNTMAAITLGLLSLLLAVLLPIFLAPNVEISPIVGAGLGLTLRMIPYLLLASQIAASFLASVRVRK
jgi:tetratricopeptide (TPR) repeat protein